ncbi:outer membrane beta-barrel protein [Helicobacter aurati]|nr:outer membrane beta-barrel protein [Helicobacter aurati]
MKKLLALGVISFSLSASLAEARFFLGVEGGYSRGVATFSNGFASDSYKNFIDSTLEGWNADIDIGGQWFFGERIGIRTFLGLGYGQAYVNSESLHDVNMNINFDFMADLIKGSSVSFGVFVGAGGGYSFTTQSLGLSPLILGATFPIYARAGFSVGLGENSRIDITAKLPLLTYSVIGFQGFDSLSEDDKKDLSEFGIVGAYNPVRFSVSYKYVF